MSLRFRGTRLRITALLMITCTVLMGVYRPARAAEPQPMSVFSIDAGRKYFTADQLIGIIDHAADRGYTDVQLILGNDGMRFLLDDMSITTPEGRTYESDHVKAAIEAGNKSYYDDPDGVALTQSDMDRILAHAKVRGIRVIPLVNSPGHMDALLVAMSELGIADPAFSQGGKTSRRTVDLGNGEALAFTKALIGKYARYFGSSGAVDIFNFGADEYANDVFRDPGWAEIQQNGMYSQFVAYANDLSDIIARAGMRPMCFNDGVYYNRRTDMGAFNPDLIVSYWTAGWGGFDVARPEFIAERGHKILNTNDGWYWVLGRMTGGYGYENAFAAPVTLDFADVPGAQGPVSTIGSMQCVWCDQPQAAYDRDAVFKLMDAFSDAYAQSMPRPANYEAVDAALDEVPGDLSMYTDESVQVLKDAVAAVVRGKRAGEQGTVDGWAAAIRAAVAGLKLRPADYTALDAALGTIPPDLSRFEEAGVRALERAKSAVVRGLDITHQAEVDQMTADIVAAVAGLTERPKDPAGETPRPAPAPRRSPKRTRGALPRTGDHARAAMAALAAMGAAAALLAVRVRKADDPA